MTEALVDADSWQRARNCATWGMFAEAIELYETVIAHIDRLVRGSTSAGRVDASTRNMCISDKAMLMEELSAVKTLERECENFESAIAQRAGEPQTPPTDPQVWEKPRTMPRPSRATTTSSSGAGRQPAKTARSSKQNPDRSYAVPSSYATVAVPMKVTKSDAGSKDADEESKVGNEEFDTTGFESELVERIKQNILDRTPSVRWGDISGLSNVKRLLIEAVVLPVMHPQFFTGIRRACRGICLFGPPGTGKTLLAKAVATECNSTFFSVSASTLTSKFRGDSEKLVSILFAMARHYAPSVIFVDEIDSIASVRGSDGEHEASRRVKSELLVQMDGCASTDDAVLLLAATNHPWDLDEALLRRLEKRIYIGLPDVDARRNILVNAFAEIKISDDVNFDVLAEKLDGYSCADIANICRDAALTPMRDHLQTLSIEDFRELDVNVIDAPVEMKHVLHSIQKIRPTVKPGDVIRHKKWMDERGAN